MKFWDYGAHELDGYQQSGDIHGKFFGTWLRQTGTGQVIIISFGDETKRYWLQMGNCFHGNYATPERAALEADRLLSANAIGQRGAACGASAAPTGCASNGKEGEA